MYPLMFATAFVLSIALYATTQIRAEREATQQREVQVLASNSLIYLGRVKAFVRGNPSFAGPIDDASLNLPSWYSKMDELGAVASSGQGFVYVQGASEREAIDALNAMRLQHPYGKNVGGTVLSNSGELFPVPGDVPEGAYVLKF